MCRVCACTPGFRRMTMFINKLPRHAREQVYSWSGWGEAIRPERLAQVRAEDISRWVVSQYPRRPYQAVAIGSASGALVHLCAALGIPWLPQTFLIPVRQPGIPPDEPQRDLEWGRGPARLLLEANPELQLHHTHDANQDRLMIQHMTYFRVKRLCLGETYEQFLEEVLRPGDTLILIECQLTWPTVRVDERYIFQHGALGGATPEECKHGSVRVAEYLARYGSHRRRWEAPPPNGERPEAEWGFEPALRQDVERLAQRRGYRLRRLVFANPERLSLPVAELYRRWYRQRGLPANRLLVESFIVMEPYWVLRTGSTPFWMSFNTGPSADWLEQYLDKVELFNEVYMMLFSHGVDSVGVVPIERWRSILRRGRKSGAFVGVDEEAYPRDFATFIRYYTDLKKKIPARYPIPGPLALDRFDAFWGEAGGRYPVRWTGQLSAEDGQPEAAERISSSAELRRRG